MACFPREIFRILTLKTPFPGFLSHSRRILASSNEALKTGGLFQQGQFPYCGGYEARRVQTFSRFQLGLLLLLLSKNIFIMKNLTDFRKSMETGVDPCLR